MCACAHIIGNETTIWVYWKELPNRAICCNTTLRGELLGFFFFKIYLFLERGDGRGKRERNIHVWLSLVHTLNWDQTCSPGLCPDQGSNLRPLALGDNTHPTEPHQSGHTVVFKYLLTKGGVCFLEGSRARRECHSSSCMRITGDVSF